MEKKYITWWIHQIVSPKASKQVLPPVQSSAALEAPILCDSCKDNRDGAFLDPDVPAYVYRIISCLFF